MYVILATAIDIFKQNDFGSNGLPCSFYKTHPDDPLSFLPLQHLSYLSCWPVQELVHPRSFRLLTRSEIMKNNIVVRDIYIYCKLFYLTMHQMQMHAGAISKI